MLCRARVTTAIDVRPHLNLLSRINFFLLCPPNGVTKQDNICLDKIYFRRTPPPFLPRRRRTCTERSFTIAIVGRGAINSYLCMFFSVFQNSGTSGSGLMGKNIDK